MFDDAVEMGLIAHHGQTRKYTGEPYFNHCLEVYNILTDVVGESKATLSMRIAALLHDTIEDTDVTMERLKAVFGSKIADLVFELTNEYEVETHPHLNRKERKYLEAQRLSKISAEAQTVKYADFLSNGSTILEHDPKFGGTYINEIHEAVSIMEDGNPILRQKVFEMIEKNKEYVIENK